MFNLISTSYQEPLFQALVWDIFFKDRQRGISIKKNLPWLIKPCGHLWFVYVWREDQLIGGAMIKESFINGAVIGSIGLVCIDYDHQGRGLSKKILVEIIKTASKKKYDALTLWTSKHNVYKPLGFNLMDNAIFGTADFCDLQVETRPYKIKSFTKCIGIPAFAKDGQVIVSDRASIKVVFDIKGPILAEWDGNLGEVVRLLKSVSTKIWRINAFEKDSLLAELANLGVIVKMEKVNLQMWLDLSKRIKIKELIYSNYFRVLDRV